MDKVIVNMKIWRGGKDQPKKKYGVVILIGCNTLIKCIKTYYMWLYRIGGIKNTKNENS